jgi:hypothetical protein
MTAGEAYFWERVGKAELFQLFPKPIKDILSFRWSETTEESLFWLLLIVDVNSRKNAFAFQTSKKGIPQCCAFSE